MTSLLWGIDLGGTKIEGAVLNSTEAKQVVQRMRVSTGADRGYSHILEQINGLIEKLKSETGQTPRKLGIGTPGTLDPKTQTLKNSNTLCLNGRPFKKDLEQKLGIPVNIANDANCFAVAEANIGAVPEVLPDAKVVFGVIMGTGVGGGLVVNGQSILGKQGIAGEWGHNFLDASGGRCYCGKTGCVETVIAGPSLERFYGQLSGQPRRLPEIMDLYFNQKDSDATQTVERLIHFFGKAMANLINILDPDAIVLGGGLGNIDLLYTEGVKEVEKHIFNNCLDTVFLKPKLGDSAGVFGAALL